MKIIAIDWAHNSENIAIYDGKIILEEIPKLVKNDIVLTENMPSKQVKEFIKNDVKVLRCASIETSKLREESNIEKNNENDAKIIWNLYQQKPKTFREFSGDMKLVSLYTAYKNMQQNKVAFQLCSWALDDEGLEEIQKQMIVLEKLMLKKANQEAQLHPIYQKFLEKIKGIGPSLSSGLIAYTGNISRFDNVSKLWKYFGYDVRNGEAPKKKKGQESNWHHKGRSLCYLIGDQFIKQRTPLYRKIYDEEKQRQLERHIEGKCIKCNKLKISHKPGHPDAMARRKTIKIFLQHYWIKYRELEGLPTNKPWIIEHGGHTNYIEPNSA